MIALLLWLWLHPFHSSITEVHYQPQSRSLECSTRLFRDDAEQAMAAMLKQPGWQLQQGPAGAQVLARYLAQHVQVLGQPACTLQVLGWEPERDAIWVHYELKPCTLSASVDLQISLLTEIFDDQTNLLTLHHQGQQVSHLFTTRQARTSLQLPTGQH